MYERQETRSAPRSTAGFLAGAGLLVLLLTEAADTTHPAMLITGGVALFTGLSALLR